MTRQASSRCRIERTAALAAITLLLGLMPAAAQQAPSQDQNGVREILGQAERAGARQTLGGALGNLGGVSRAEAQTAPRQPPVSIEVGAGQASSSPIVLAQVATPPAAQAGPTGNGTPADPTMIIRVPAAPGNARTTAGATEPTSAPTAVAAPIASPVASPAPFANTAPVAGARPIANATSGRIIVAEAPVAQARRRFVIVGGMCQPR